MKRERELISYLAKQEKKVILDDIIGKLKCSYNTIRETIKNINIDDSNGCFIDKKGKYYFLLVIDERIFNSYMNQKSLCIDYRNQEDRVGLILYYLLQSDQYEQTEKLARKCSISRTTLYKDFDKVEEKLEIYGLTLSRIRKKGVKITGQQKDIRRCFNKYVINSEYNLEPTRLYTDFMRTLNKEELIKRVRTIFAKNEIDVPSYALENIVTHFQIILYQSLKNNGVESYLIGEDVDDKFMQIANALADYANSIFGIVLDNDQIKCLAFEVQTKVTATEIPALSRQELEESIIFSLTELDNDFCTSFKSDRELIENLELHIYPMVKRVNYDYQFKNPIIEEYYEEYTNVFTIAIRFCELLRKRMSLSSYMSKDEIGLLSLHFANHFEKIKNSKIENTRYIVVLCSTGKSTSVLIKTRLKSLFSNARIMVSSLNDIDKYDDELPDIFLTTIPNQRTAYKKVPVIQIKELINDEELERIKNIVSLEARNAGVIFDSSPLEKLFDKELFQIITGGEYLKTIKEQAIKIVSMGYASEEYPDLVIEREIIYPTIFENGIATPHPTKLIASKNCIGITIVKGEMKYNDRDLHLIVLINLKKESFDLHQELQKLILKIIKDHNLRENVLSSINYEDFIYKIRKAL